MKCNPGLMPRRDFFKGNRVGCLNDTERSVQLLKVLCPGVIRVQSGAERSLRNGQGESADVVAKWTVAVGDKEGKGKKDCRCPWAGLDCVQYKVDAGYHKSRVVELAVGFGCKVKW